MRYIDWELVTAGLIGFGFVAFGFVAGMLFALLTYT